MSPIRQFTTIDDVIELAEKLTTRLRRLGEYRHPLAVRRGVREMTKEDNESKQVKGSGRTYFFDVETTREGKGYLRITESRKGKGEKWERNTINVFPEDAAEFAAVVSEMAAKLG